MKTQILILLSFLAVSFSNATDKWVNIATPQTINEIEFINGKYYIASDGGLIIYDAVSDTKDHIFRTAGLPSSRIEDIALDGNGNLWIGTYDNGVAVFQNDQWIAIPDPIVSSNPLFFYCMEFDDNGALWLGTSNGMHKYHNGNWTSESLLPVWDMVKMQDGSILAASFTPYIISNGYVEEDTSCPVFAYSGSTVGTLANGDYIFSGPGFGVAHRTGNSWQVFDINNSVIPLSGLSDLEVANDGLVWGIAAGKGVYSFDGSVWKLEIDKSQLADLNFSSIQIFPTSDNLIIGTTGSLTFYDGNTFQKTDLKYKGLVTNNSEISRNDNGNILLKNGIKWYEYKTPLNTTAELPLPGSYNDISSLMLVDMPDGSVALFDHITAELWHNGSAIKLYDPAMAPFGPGSWIRSLLVDDDYNYWIGTLKGLFRTDGTTSHYFTDSNSVFYDPSFWALGEDRMGNIWASTPDGIGMWDGNLWTYYEASDYNHIFGGAGFDFYFDENNELWFVGWGTGLVHFDGFNWEAYTTLNSNIADHMVFDIEAKNGNLYLSTNSGLSVFDGSDFNNYTIENSAILSNSISQLRFDKDDNLWMVHPGTGLSVFNKNGVPLGNLTLSPEDIIMFDMFPNPAGELLNIKVDRTIEDPDIRIIDLNGRMLFESRNKYDIKVDLSSISTGLYIVQLGRYSARLIVD